MQVDNYVSDRNRKRRKRRIYFYGVITILILYFLVFGTLWFIFRSPLFRVDSVVVRGNSAVTSDAVVSLMQSSALRNHSFFGALLGFRNILLWPGSLSPSDLAFIPALQSVQISKDYFDHEITVTVVERQPFGTWCLAASGECYWFDGDGIVFKHALDTQGGSIPSIEDDSQTKLGLNEEVLPNEFVGSFISIMKALRETNLSVANVKLADLSLEEIDVTTNKGPDVYFSLRFPADNDVPVIESVMQQSNYSKLQYIDCRTENRVYYK